MTTSRSGSRGAGLLGLGWLVLFLPGTAALQGEPPAGDAAVAEVRAFFQDHGARYLAGDFIVGCAFVLLLIPFVAALPRALGVTGRAAGCWPTLALGGVVALVTVGGTATSFLDAVAIARGAPDIDDPTIAALLSANSAGIALIGLPAALLSAAAAMLVWRSTLSRTIAVLGWCAAPLLVAGAAFPVAGTGHGLLWTIRFVSFVVFAAFILATSVGLLAARQPEGARPEPEPV
jgi:hypothetical protein